MKFYLGTHETHWLFKTTIPLFVSHRRLKRRLSTYPKATVDYWSLDSGGFTELSMFGEWKTSEIEYVEAIDRYESELGALDWVAPQDWMCEPWILAKTGKTVEEHQQLTIASVVSMRARGVTVIPVLQGWTLDDYVSHVELYEKAGFDLSSEEVVGLGSVCRRQATSEIDEIVHTLWSAGLSLHGFGVKTSGLRRYGALLASADSMAWSYTARMADPMPGHSHQSCQNCLSFARRWRTQVLDFAHQGRFPL